VVGRLGIGAKFQHAARDVYRAGNLAALLNLRRVAHVDHQGVALVDHLARLSRCDLRNRGVGGFHHLLYACRHLCLLSLITHHTSAIVTAYTLWDFPTTDTLPSVGLATPQKMPLEWFRNGHNLDLLVDRRCRTGGVLQLLLAQTDRLKAF